MQWMLDWADAHPLSAMAFLALVAFGGCAWILWAPLPQDPDLGTGDLGAAIRDGPAYHWTAEGGLRRVGDPGPRRIGGEVDEASGLPTPV
jgi:hypothetical protein